MDLRIRMVILGLILGVVVAVLFAAQGCGSNHPGTRHADADISRTSAHALAAAHRAG